MNALEQPTTAVTLEDLSREILSCAQGGDVDGLSGLVARLKALGQRNVYVVAVEKQLAKLTAPETTPEHRTELLKAFPVLMERANAEARRLASAPVRPDPNEERREAMEKMKRQYFERADSFVDRGEFQRALEEVRRVLILDKTNTLALEYEQKITHLIDAAAPAAPAVEQAPPAAEAAPAPAVRRPASSMRWIAAAVFLVVIVGSAAAFFLTRGQSGPSTENAAAVGTMTVAVVPPPSPADNAAGNASASTPQTAAVQPSSRPEPTPVSAEPKPAVAPQPKPSAPIAAAATAPKSSSSSTGTPAAGTVAPPVAQPEAVPVQEATPPPQPFVPTETSVEVVRIPPLRYPEVAMRNRIEGRVVVEVAVNAGGKPVETRILRSDNELLDDAAIEAAMNASYKPATMNESPVASKVSIPFDFRLKR